MIALFFLRSIIQLFKKLNSDSLFHLTGKIILILLLFFSGNYFCNAQTPQTHQIEIIQATSLEGSKINNVEVRRLIGDVIFKQEDTYMYCDSALFYEATNSIDAYSRIRIENPRVKMTGDVLHYDGNDKKALITGKVVTLTDSKMVLTTTAMNYDVANDIGNYTVGGKVEDHENVLTSKTGYYFSKDRNVFFKDHVVLVNPKYIMRSDTLKYNTPSETAYFLGPSTINSTGTDSTIIYCEYGWYNTKTEKSYFSEHAYMQSKENTLKGDSILYDRQLRIGRAWRNVQVVDTLQKIIINGDYAILEEIKGTSFVTGTSMLTKIFDTDSMFLHADTLFAKQDTTTKQKWYFAYHHTRIFKKDLQGQCDSLVYSTIDSTIWFYGHPILWNNNNQLTADTLNLTLEDNHLHTMHLFANSFITGLEDSLRFNQVKGRNMTGYFTENKLSSIHVVGNGQTIYYIRNNKKQLSSVNSADCSDMIIYIDSSKVRKITLINQPDATLHPIKELAPSELRLKDFQWWGFKQPKTKEDIFEWR